MKTLLGRMRPFVENKKLKGKRAVLVAPAAEGPKTCDKLVEMFCLSFKYLDVDFMGQVLVEAFEKGKIGKNTSEMERAYERGVSQ